MTKATTVTARNATNENASRFARYATTGGHSTFRTNGSHARGDCAPHDLGERRCGARAADGRRHVWVRPQQADPPLGRLLLDAREEPRLRDARPPRRRRLRDRACGAAGDAARQAALPDHGRRPPCAPRLARELVARARAVQEHVPAQDLLRAASRARPADRARRGGSGRGSGGAVAARGNREDDRP